MHYYPSIIKGKPFAGPSGRSGETIVYIPYSFGMPERHYFIQNLAPVSGSKIQDHPQRKALASLLRQLRCNGFRYVALYGIENDPVRFLDGLTRKDTPSKFTADCSISIRSTATWIFTATSASTSQPFITVFTRGSCFRTSSTDCVP